MSKKSCLNCKHHKSNFSKDSYGFPDIDKPLVHICKIGNQEVCDTWWLENGEKVDEELKDDLDCFEPHESSVLLGKMSDCLDKMKEVLDK